MAKLYVSNKDESVRMFENRWLEHLSKVHFSVPLIIYLPVVGWFIYLAFSTGVLDPLYIFLLFGAGVFTWTVVEYVLHRFVFHYVPPGRLGNKIHFIFHGVHHDYPNDSYRLVMPPIVSIPLAIFFYFSFSAILGEVINAPFFAGFVMGYLFYDMLHYAVHHANSSNKLFLKLKTHHLKHHFKEPHKGFGVSSPLWDILSGTTFTRRKSNQ